MSILTAVRLRLSRSADKEVSLMDKCLQRTLFKDMAMSLRYMKSTGLKHLHSGARVRSPFSKQDPR